MKDRLSDFDEESMINRYHMPKEDWRCEHWDLKRKLEFNSKIFFIKLRERKTYCEDIIFFVFDGEKIRCVNGDLSKIFSDFLRGTKKRRWWYPMGTSVVYNMSVLRIPFIVKLPDGNSLRMFGDLNQLFNLVFKNVELVELN